MYHFPSQSTALPPPPPSGPDPQRQLSTGFLIYGPLYKKGLGTLHFLSSDIESQLPSMEMRVVCYCVKAYLHCAVKLSAVTTACLLTLAHKFIFACRDVWSRHVTGSFGEKVQWRRIVFILTGLCLCVCLLLQWGYEWNIYSKTYTYFPSAVCAPPFEEKYALLYLV